MTFWKMIGVCGRELGELGLESMRRKRVPALRGENFNLAAAEAAGVSEMARCC